MRFSLATIHTTDATTIGSDSATSYLTRPRVYPRLGCASDRPDLAATGHWFPRVIPHLGIPVIAPRLHAPRCCRCVAGGHPQPDRSAPSEDPAGKADPARGEGANDYRDNRRRAP